METFERNKPNSPEVSSAAIAGTAIIAHKFGGSSLADAQRIAHVATLLRERDEVQIVVVSAMHGVTDALIALTQQAATGSHWQASWQTLRAQHLATSEQLLGDQATQINSNLECSFQELADRLHAIAVLRSVERNVADAISGQGEIWSAQLLHAVLQGSGINYALLDAREVLVVRHEELGVAVDWEATSALLARWRESNSQSRIIVTGYIAREANGRATVLGRNGSDYSAAIFAALWQAQELHIWTDVDGVLSADPRVEPEAVTLAAMSYAEACELAYFGAKVIHPQTMAPAIARGLPIFIRNTFRPELAGTRIDADGDDAGPVKGLTLAHDLALINVEGNGMIGVPGTAQRLFAALQATQISVMMISQGSSEHSICCVVRADQASVAKVAIENAFARELDAGQLNGVQSCGGIAVLAAVGDRMAGQPGIAARLFGALARARVNIRAIAQGASERNISIAIDAQDATRALRAAHAAFYLSAQTISIGVIGPGHVGAALLDQIAAASARLKLNSNLDLRVRAIAGSKRMWLDQRGHAGEQWRNWTQGAQLDCDLVALGEHVNATRLPHAIIIDCSASDAVAAHYPHWLAAGIHVITPNKHAGAGPLNRYRAIRDACASGAARFRYEATVGAGLPIIQTLRDLLDTGDELIAIDGILSGTLAWLFNRFDGSVAFSVLVREAHALGYTEPDPRDDLSGTDVARKLVILAREAGCELSLADVDVENLVPHTLLDADANDFMSRLDELDAPMAQHLAQARSRQRVLRYVAHLQSDGVARVSLVELPCDHPFANIKLTDNIVQFTTMRYRDNPLIVQGPGAGPQVTAAGVFSDLLRVASALGAQV
ncbi:MAG: bifunctional aspartate kinase/homoserine dehydrogenase I [Rudaea sp.]